MNNLHLAADKMTVFLLPFAIFWFLQKRPAFILESRLAQTQIPLLNWPISNLIIGGCAIVVYGGILAPVVRIEIETYDARFVEGFFRRLAFWVVGVDCLCDFPRSVLIALTHI